MSFYWAAGNVICGLRARHQQLSRNHGDRPIISARLENLATLRRQQSNHPALGTF